MRPDAELLFDELMTSDWLLPPRTARGVVERSFVLRRNDRRVPGVIWCPSGADTLPLLLLGHGGSGHKRDPRVAGRARAFVDEVGVAVVAIDGPRHGDRVQAPLATQEYQEQIVAEGIEAVAADLVADWLAVVDALAATGIVDPARVGYLGTSMGTRFGVPTAAALGDKLRCAVLGKFGLVQSDAFPAGYDNAAQVRRAAARITAPTLVHIQWQDEVFPLPGQLELFETLGGPHKQLMAHVGTHAETSPAAERAWREFVATYLP